MHPYFKCLDCKTSLTPKKYQGEAWYSCQTCKSSFASVQSFKTVLSEFEYNKLNAEIRRAQIVSTDPCPRCQKNMVKVIDLVRINHVEACASCQMVWLDPGEGEKINRDQKIENETDRKVQLADHGPIDNFASITDGLNEPVYSPMGSSYIFILNGIVKTLGLGYFAKRHPLLAFIVFIAIVLGLAVLIAFIPGFFNMLWVGRVLSGS